MRRALPALLALALLAGCGGDGDGGKKADASVVERAIAASEREKSYRIRFRLESDLGGQELTFSGEGVSSTDQSRGRYEGTFRLEDGQEQSVEMISADGANYMRGEPFAAALPPGKTWLKVSDETPTTLTPAELFGLLRRTEEVEEVGREVIRGEPALHLRSPLDMERLAEESDEPVAKRFAQFPQLSELETTLDLWLAESDDRLVRMALEVTHPDVPGEMQMNGDILEYDVPLSDVEAPPAGEVAETAG